ncbi:MAG: hypothetical protein AAF184_09885 [Pseudomonadota bacterium]
MTISRPTTKTPWILAPLLLAPGLAAAQQTTMFFTSNNDYTLTNTFSEVSVFNIEIVIDAPLEAGTAYVDPPITSVTYQVQGELEDGTPSGFPAFDLQREITGEDFYAQGSSLSFEIDAAAVLDDGVQVSELVGEEVVFTFNGREMDTGRFHPALFELRADGTGRLQNSNNAPAGEAIGFGEEYITDLMFDPGNTTLLSTVSEPIPPDDDDGGSDDDDEDNGGGGAFGWLGLALLAGAARATRSRQRAS